MANQPRKGVYLLPNLMTTGALFAGFYSIIAGIGGQFIPAAIAVVIAGFLDGLDGRLARLTNTRHPPKARTCRTLLPWVDCGYTVLQWKWLWGPL